MHCCPYGHHDPSVGHGGHGAYSFSGGETDLQTDNYSVVWHVLGQGNYKERLKHREGTSHIAWVGFEGLPRGRSVSNVASFPSFMLSGTFNPFHPIINTSTNNYICLFRQQVFIEPWRYISRQNRENPRPHRPSILIGRCWQLKACIQYMMYIFRDNWKVCNREFKSIIARTYIMYRCLEC